MNGLETTTVYKRDGTRHSKTRGGARERARSGRSKGQLVCVISLHKRLNEQAARRLLCLQTCASALAACTWYNGVYAALWDRQFLSQSNHVASPRSAH